MSVELESGGRTVYTGCHVATLNCLDRAIQEPYETVLDAGASYRHSWFASPLEIKQDGARHRGIPRNLGNVEIPLDCL